VSFRQADGRLLPFEKQSFDVVIFDSTLCHVPDASKAVAEAERVLRRGGCIAAFDGDYATTTVALGDYDPLQACVDAMMAGSVNDRWIARKLPSLMQASGLHVTDFSGYSFIDSSGDYMLTIVDRGADMLAAEGQLDALAATSLKAEARRRLEQGTFFGHIAYASVVALKND
jgi:ubiquinone/menaquinone biosynthesis C-methylase UbiE